MRRSLASIDAARSFQYDAKFFGNFNDKMRTTEDRSKYRFGLKSNLEFLTQLDRKFIDVCNEKGKETNLCQDATRYSCTTDLSVT